MKQSLSQNSLADCNKVTLDKILAIEKDVMELKLTVFKKFSPMGKKVLKLKGILPGIEITDEDIAQAKQSLYSKAGI